MASRACACRKWRPERSSVSAARSHREARRLRRSSELPQGWEKPSAPRRHAFDDMKQAVISRPLVRKLRKYMSDVERSRQELSESTQEHTLPPIPPGNHHEKNRAVVPKELPDPEPFPSPTTIWTGGPAVACPETLTSSRPAGGRVRPLSFSRGLGRVQGDLKESATVLGRDAQITAAAAGGTLARVVRERVQKQPRQLDAAIPAAARTRQPPSFQVHRNAHPLNLVRLPAPFNPRGNRPSASRRARPEPVSDPLACRP